MNEHRHDTEPRTEAGRRLDAAIEEANGPNEDVTRAILAIEREAAAAPAATQALRAALKQGLLDSGRWVGGEIAADDWLDVALASLEPSPALRLVQAVEAIGKGELMDLVEFTDPETVVDAILAYPFASVSAGKDVEDTLRTIQRDLDG
jgi:hypothetical protein